MHLKVAEAKLLIQDLLKEEALDRVHQAMEKEDFDTLIKSIQARHMARKVLRVCVCVLPPFILDVGFVGRTSRGHTGGRSHRISHPPSFCGACLNFSREKDSAVPFSRRP